MVALPAGEFVMGSPPNERGRGKDEGPQRKVTVPAFAVGKFEVTFAQWDACAAEGGCAHKPGDQGWGRGRLPVINVSWDDARQFVAWLAKKSGKAYRLPTEAEWEYAARGATKASAPYAPFSTGATINYKQANYDANFTYGSSGKMGIYRQKTVEAGSLPRNAFGLHEMHGNVWEWVEDCYRDSYEGAPTDGSAVSARNCALGVLRGGAWNYYPRLLRSAYRYATARDVRLENVGFRVLNLRPNGGAVT
jgi:formylglycine-generating enzyme required for sulfatase activity